jgi:CBS domain-containing protein
MMMSDKRSEFPLRMVTREVFWGDGQSEMDSEVFCPRRGAVPLATCLDCEHSEGFGKTANGRRSHLLCSLPGAVPSMSMDRWVGPDQISISTIMSTNIVCVRESLSLDALARLFLDRGISGVPVLNADGIPIGVVSKTDLVVDETLGQTPRVTVADIMMPLALTLGEEATISQASALMAVENIHRIPVVSQSGKIIGILSTLDILRWLAQQDG